MANLVIDIGNTALKAAWAEGMTIGKTFRYQGEKMTGFILSLTEKIKPEIMIISSVREISEKDRSLFRKECAELLIADPSSGKMLSDYNLPDYLTPDRAASIIASRYLFKGMGVTVFDFGTTLTIDFLDAEGHYSGGNISPGCRTRFKSVNRYSKRLPLLNTPEKTGEIGDSVVSSIETGIIKGIVFEIDGYIAQYPDNIVVFTGGDAIYFANKMKNSIFVVCNLVLMGLALIADNYDKRLG